MGVVKESLILNFILPISDLKFKTQIHGWYKSINSMQKWSPEKIKSWQQAKLHDLLTTAYDHSCYYHELFDKIGIKPNDIKSIEDLKIIPPLTKEIIRERMDDILLDTKDNYNYKLGATGGSTGNPTKYYKDNNSWGFDNAYNITMWKQTGYRYGDKFLALGSSSIFPTNKKSFVHDLFYRMKGKTPFNAMNMSDEILENCLNVILENKIHYIYGYASSIFLLAKYVIDKKYQNKLSIKACFPTSEILTDTYRNVIKQAFNCSILDSYGAHDGGIVAHNLGDGFKVGYNCIVQLKDKENNQGSALLTDLTNMVFPFIRYELGDELKMGQGYNSFFNGQVIEKVIGRTSDIIELSNGRKLTGPGFTILFKDLNIIGYRILKTGPLELTIEIVKNQNYTEAEEKLIIDTLHKHAGADCSIKIVYVEEISKRANGKNLFFLND